MELIRKKKMHPNMYYNSITLPNPGIRLHNFFFQDGQYFRLGNHSAIMSWTGNITSLTPTNHGWCLLRVIGEDGPGYRRNIMKHTGGVVKLGEDIQKLLTC